MDAHDNSANVPIDALDCHEAETVAAARVHSIDYGPIIEDAVAGLARNTSERRSEIYAHARSIVTRDLQLMRIPEPIIELEKLALDLAIRKIEQRWQAREGVERIAASGEVPLNLAPRSRRRLVSPTGIAAALSAIAATICFALYFNGNVASTRLIYNLVERWVDPGSKPDVTRIAAGNAAADGGPAKMAPIHAAFAAEREAPAATIAACDAGSSMPEHNPCTRDSSGGGAAPETAKADPGPPWLESFTAFGDMTSGRAPSKTPNIPAVAAEEVAVAGAEPYGVPARSEALTSPDAVPPVAAPQAPSVAVKPISPKVAALLESGKRAAFKGDLDRAVRDYGEAIRIDPKYPDGYFERGLVFFKLGDIERAIADYSAALAQNLQHGAALRARGMAHLYRAETDLALTDLSKAIELGESDPRLLAPIELFYARRSRGSIYDSKQQYDLEIADCTALIESVAHDPTLAEALAANYGTAGTTNILAVVYRQRANAFVRRSNVERAVADLTEAIPLSADRGYAALIDRSKLHEGLGRRDLAVADARAALNIRPSSEEARLALSRLSALSSPTPPKGL